MGRKNPKDHGTSVRWSPDFYAYAEGKTPAHAVRCALCGTSPCACPPFGTPEYLALLARPHNH